MNFSEGLLLGNLGLGVLNSALGTVDTAINAGIANKNYNLQKDNLNYQKRLQNEIFVREDNAVQRRAADLEAAGLSKTLAAGSAASAGQVIATTAPQNGYNSAMLDKLQMVMNNAMITQGITKSRAETENIKAQNNLIDEQVNAARLDNFAKNYENQNNLIEKTRALKLANAKSKVERDKINADIDKVKVDTADKNIDLFRNQSDYQIEQYNALHSKNAATPSTLRGGLLRSLEALNVGQARFTARVHQNIRNKINSYKEKRKK